MRPQPDSLPKVRFADNEWRLENQVSRLRRILAATDLSTCARFAEKRAAMLCAELKIDTFEMLNVVDDSLSGTLSRLLEGAAINAEAHEELARIELQRFAEELQQDYGVACHFSVESGRPATRISTHADGMAADLIVMGAHGCNSVSTDFIGNTPYKLMHIGRQPLLIVRNHPAHPYRNVLVPVDFSEDSKNAAEIALAVAPSASVTLLHGFEVVNEGLMHYAGVSIESIGGLRNQARAEAVAEMDGFIADLDKADRMITSSVQYGYPPAVILEYVDTFKPDLIVIGKHGKNRVEDLLLGSVTRHTIEESACDILVALSSKT